MALDFKGKTLHHELAWWPVAASVVIMLFGFVVMTCWLAYASVSDRKKLLLTFAQFAREDLEYELTRVHHDVTDLGTRVPDSGPRGIEPLLVDERFMSRYDLLLFLNDRGQVFRAVSRKADPAKLTSLEGADYRPILGFSSGVGALDSVLSGAPGAAISVRQFPAVNRLLNRPDHPRSRDELPQFYQFVIAVPVQARGQSDAARGPKVLGAVVAVISWDPFQKLLDRIESKSSLFGLRTGYAYLMNSDGNTTIGHKHRDPGQWPAADNLYGTRVEEDHHLPELRRSLQNEPGTVFGYWFRGTRKYAALQRIQPPDPNLEEALAWRLGVGVDLPDMLRAVVPSTILVLVIGVLVTGAVFVASSFIASRASLSVHEMTQFVNAAARGEFTVVSASTSHDELTQLHDAISGLILSLRADVGFAPLPNPYIVGTPVRSPEMFFGRESELAWVAEQLRAPSNALILLSGPRRIGKTSLLHSIRRAQDAIGILPFFFDTQMLMQDINDDASFFRLLSNGLVDQLSSLFPQLPKPQLDFGSGKGQAIRKFLKYINRRVKLTPVFLFDEFENLQSKVHQDVLSSEIFQFFAALLDGELRVSLVVTGSDHIERRVSDRRSSSGLSALIVKGVRRRINVLSHDQAQRILIEPLKGRIGYAPGVIERILRFTGGHPYYTQDFCHRLISTLNQIHQVRVTEDITADVMGRVLDNPPPQLDHAWQQFPDVSRVLLSGLAAALPDPAEWVDIQNAINTLPPDYHATLQRRRQQLHNALLSLEHQDWLELSQSGYRFRIDLYRCWVKREHPTTQLMMFNLEQLARGSDVIESIS